MDKKIRHIAFLVMPQATLLDITGPYEVFTQANFYQEQNQYILHTISTERKKQIRTTSGMIIHCDDTIHSVSYNIDTLFVPGVSNMYKGDYTELVPEKVQHWLYKQSTQVRRMCSVCTGTFFLAMTGILDGRKVTTHWEQCEALAKRYPGIQVDPDPIFVKDGNIYTSAGITAGMDLALALIEEDLGRKIALEVARQMVLYLKRPGNQSQYSSALIHQKTDYRPVQDIQHWILENPGEEITVEALAERALMSPRNFARVFVKETGTTPGKFVEKVRVETACRMLVETQLSLKEIASASGLGSVDNMRIQFGKHLKTTPAEYRHNFRSAY